MRLTIKLVLWFLVCATLAVGINGAYGVRGELERYETDLAARHVVMGRVLRSAFSEVMDTDGEARAVSVLDYTDKRLRLVDVRWVHLEDNPPPERTPSTPLRELTPLRADREVHTKSDGRLRSYVPMHIEGRSLSALEFSETLAGENEVVRHAILRELRAVGAMAVAIGIAAAILGAFFVARPIRRLMEHARRIGQFDLSPAVPPAGTDEIAQLGREMNAMCAQLAEAQAAKLKALDQLRHAERLNTVGKLSAGLAHELGTPLNVITLRAKAIAGGRATGARAEEAGKSIAEQATRVTHLVRQLLDFARRRPIQQGKVDVREVIQRTTNLVDPVATKASVRLVGPSVEGPLLVVGDAGQLEQVLTNLVMNAIQAVPEGGRVTFSTRTVEATPPAGHGGTARSWVRLEVEDNGTGIADAALPHVFEPFFTTKDVGEGTGLGLAVCYGIIQDHGGWIEVATAPGKGTTFAVFLPQEAS